MGSVMLILYAWIGIAKFEYRFKMRIVEEKLDKGPNFLIRIS